MNVLVDALALEAPASSSRGIGFYTRWQFKALLNQDRFHHYTWLNHPRFPFKNPPRDERGSGSLPNVDARAIDAMPGDVWPGLFDQNERDLRTLLATKAYDVYYCTSPFELAYPPALPLPQFAVPTVGTLYDLIPLRFPEKYLSPMLPCDRERYARACKAISRFERVLAISECSRQEAIRLLGIDPRKIINISAGVEDDFFVAPGDLEIEATLTRHDVQPPYVLYPSGFDWRKNIEGMIHAFGALPQSLRDRFQLVVLCSLRSSEREYLETVAAKAGCSESIVLTGAVSHEDLKCFYYGAAVVAFLSLYEGFGLPVLEAMASGRAVVGSCTSSIPEVLGDTGFLVDPEDRTAIVASLKAALVEKRRTEELGARARERACQFTWTAVAERTLEALEGARRPRHHSSAPRLRIAYFSPLPPEESGISDYSEELLPALREEADMTVYTSRVAVEHSGGAGGCYRPYAEFSDGVLREYDALLFHVGNSTFHREIFDLLDTFEGIAVFHDLSLHRILQHLYHSGAAAERERYPRALTGYFGGDQAKVSAFLCRTSEDLELSEDYYRIRLLSAIAPRARGIIVHSHEAIRSVQKERPSVPVRRVPMGVRSPLVSREEARSRRGIAFTDFMVVVPGAVGLTKRAEINLRGFRRFLTRGGKGRLVFAGPVAPPHGTIIADVRQMTKDLRIADSVLFTGRTPQSEFDEWIAAADVGICLRYPSNGETSAALHRLLAAGIPTIVSNVDAFQEYPDEFAWKLDVDDSEVDLLAAYLQELSQSASLRSRMSDLAREYSEANHTLRRAAQEYLKVIEMFLHAGTDEARD